MKSINFEILRDGWPDLAAFGGFAESYAHEDPASALVKLRLYAENLTKDIYRDLRLPTPERPTLIDLLKNDAFTAITPKVVLDKLHALRIHGNRAAHGEPARVHQALWLLKESHDLARWLCIQYGTAKADQLPAFTQPPPDKAEVRDPQQILGKLAAQEAQLEALLVNLEVPRSKPSGHSLNAMTLRARRRLLLTNCTLTKRRLARSLSTAFWPVSVGMLEKI